MYKIIPKKRKTIKNRISYFIFNRKKGYSIDNIKEIKNIERVILATKKNLVVNKFNNIGIEVLGPVLTGYSIWLRNLAVESKADYILFLAREGESFKNVYKCLYEKNEEPLYDYLIVSRLSLLKACVPIAKSIERLLLLSSGLLNHISTIEDYCYLLGLGQESIDQISKKYSIDIHYSIKESKYYETLYVAIMDVGREYFDGINYSAVKYFKNVGIHDGKRIILADIGWSGTMQYMLQMMFPDVEFIGAYLAVNDFHQENEYVKLKRYGYVCNSNDWMARGQAIRFSTMAIESLLQNKEGSAIGYVTKNGISMAVTEEREDLHYVGPIVDSLREGYMAFASEYKKIKSDGHYKTISADISLLGYESFAIYPNLETVRFFNLYKNLSDKIDVNITSNKNLLFYIFHIGEFYKEFDKTNAKIIWLKSVFKLPLPYYRLLRFLTEKIHLKSSRQRFNESI